MRRLVRFGLLLACVGPLAALPVVSPGFSSVFSSASVAAEMQAQSPVQAPVQPHSPEPAKPASSQKLAPASHQAFVLFEFDVNKQEGFKAFAKQVRDSAKTFKGEFLMREKVDSLFGGVPSSLSVISFPSVEDAKTWLGSPAFDKLKAQRDTYADVRTYLVEKID